MGPAGPVPRSVNYVGRPVQLSLDLEAFPLPDDFLFRFHGPGKNLSEAVARDHVDIDCWNTYAAYAVTCNITVDNVGPTDAGYYSVRIRNDFGLEVVEFQITYYGNVLCMRFAFQFSLSLFLSLSLLKIKV